MSIDHELVALFNHRLCCLMRGGEDEDNIGRLSELIALAEAGLQAEEDDAFFTQAAEAADEVEAAYHRR